MKTNTLNLIKEAVCSVSILITNSKADEEQTTIFVGGGKGVKRFSVSRWNPLDSESSIWSIKSIYTFSLPE